MLQKYSNLLQSHIESNFFKITFAKLYSKKSNNELKLPGRKFMSKFTIPQSLRQGLRGSKLTFEKVNVLLFCLKIEKVVASPFGLK